MCGVAGILRMGVGGSAPTRDQLLRMITTIRHRGPDSYGFYRDGRVGLAHARLSIIDLAGGDQPLANEDETLWIVFNGEVFNYIELRVDLERRGHRFRTRTDTEVILHSYEEWGTECFVKFNGQWAVALWDARKRELCLSRDRVGVRPLYVTQQAGRLFFASEVKAIFADPAVHRGISPQGLAQVFTYWCAIAPSTVFEEVEQLIPGSFRVYGESGLQQEHRYWRASFPVRDGRVSPRTMVQAAEGLKEQLAAATRLRMTRADVPVGSYLSGGIDSSVIAWLAREHAVGTFRTFSLRFADAEFDETPFQRLMVQALGSVHDDVVVTRRDIAEIFPDVIRHAEQPVLRTAPAPLYLLSRLVRDAGFKAVLTGEGADEILAGYDIFREAKIRHFWARLPASTVRPLLFSRLYPYLKRSPALSGGMATQFWRVGLERAGMPGFSHEPRWRTTSALQRFFSADMKAAIAACRPPDYLDSLPAEFGRWDPLEQAQFLESETLLSGYLLSSQGDRMLMAHSVEGRFPFLDAEVLEFCSSLDPLQKLPGLQEKAVLKQLARGLIPESIVRRLKQPYRAPDAVCFVGSSAPEWVRECLSADALENAGLFDCASVDRLREKLDAEQPGGGRVLAPGNTDNMVFVGILSAQLVHSQFIQKTALDSSGVHGSVPVKVDYVAEKNI